VNKFSKLILVLLIAVIIIGALLMEILLAYLFLISLTFISLAILLHHIFLEVLVVILVLWSELLCGSWCLKILSILWIKVLIVMEVSLAVGALADVSTLE
jgi:hypothetical protein